MPTSLKVIHNTYSDSVALKQISAGLGGVQKAFVVMATAGDLALLRDGGPRQPVPRQPLGGSPRCKTWRGTSYIS